MCPDYCACEGKECPLKKKCFRYRMVPDDTGQSFFMNPPYDKEKKECSHFVDVEGWGNAYKLKPIED